jgi:Leucine-rich repeat (LRR) protein/tRNA A-37 threonylcarbamoyl transferase component Bud32
MSCATAFLLLVTIAFCPTPAPSEGAGEAAVLRAFIASLPPVSRRVLRPSWRATNASTSGGRSRSHCAFLGVQCTATGAVAAVNLSGAGLSGDLAATAPRLCALPALAALDLSRNRFTGAVPATLTACSVVATLLLGGNLLTGAVPLELLSSPQLRKVDLSYNTLAGDISGSSSPVLEYLDLSVNMLSGTIPLELAALPSLIYMDLSGNNLSGPVPEFPAPCRLVYLSLFSNQLSGGIPRSLANCHNLTTLYLSYNVIGGKVPDFFASLPKLQKLYLDDNKFVGELPQSIGTLVSLEQLVVSNNGFTGTVPDAIGKCQSLTMLYLDRNNFSGSIPVFVSNFSRLQKLSMAHNRISGRIPPEIGKCQELVELQLQNNSLSGTIPLEICKLSQLQNFYLHNNSLRGELPAEITQIRKLREISLFDNNFTGVLPQALGLNTTPGLVQVDLTGNHFHGEIPPGLCTGGQLSVLDLGYNQFSGSLPIGILKCESLQRLILNNNLITGNIPANLGTNIGLSYMDISGNLLHGVIPAVLGSWRNLTMLDISNNLFSGPIPRELSALTKLETLRMSSNRLTGPIPHELGNCKDLLCLDLGKNLLNGSIPAEITTLNSLQSLVLGANNLTGRIPDSFTAAQDLIELQLGDNRLEGAIPDSLGNLQYLSKALNISHNRLSGQIPNSLGKLQDLELLDLSMNSLSGPIPSQLSNMVSLLVVNISFNELSGLLPGNWPKLATKSPDGFLGNPQLCIQSDCLHRSNNQLARKLHYSKTRIIVALLVSTLAIIVAGLCVVYYIVKRSQHLSASHASVRSLDTTEELPEDLTYEDILRATDNWSEKYVIGRGRHGTVYRTECKLGKDWAVKTVDLSKCKFPIEMKILNTVKHRNIVRMEGYCIRGSVGLILYEYMPEGTLFDLLHERKPRVPLDCMARWQIALGVAQALSYLHHDCVPMIVHRDVKSSNILMDAELVPKLTDFGMGKIVCDENADATVSAIIGTLGYIAPGRFFHNLYHNLFDHITMATCTSGLTRSVLYVYPEHGYSTRLTEKSDVYSYGVVLLELLCRKTPLDSSFGDGTDIVTWMRTNLEHEDRCSIISLMDEEMTYWPEDEQEKALSLLDLAVSCTQVACQSRPSMREVVKMLLKIEK